jgi:hypothetical protein
MKKQKPNHLSQFFWLVIVILVSYLIAKLCFTPSAPEFAPEEITLSKLDSADTNRSDTYVSLNNVRVSSSVFFMERCFFCIEEDSSNVTYWCTSCRNYREGTVLSGAVFYVEPLWGKGKKTFIVLKEAKS